MREVIKKILCIILNIFFFFNFANIVTAKEYETIEIYELSYNDFFQLLTNEKTSFQKKNMHEFKFVGENQEFEYVSQARYDDNGQYIGNNGYERVDTLRYNYILLEDIRNIVNVDSIQEIINKEKDISVDITQVKILDVYSDIGIRLMVFVETKTDDYLLEINNYGEEKGVILPSIKFGENISVIVLSKDEAIEKYRIKYGNLFIEEKSTDVAVEYRNVISTIPLIQSLEELGIQIEQKKLYRLSEKMKNNVCLLLTYNNSKVYLYGNSEMDFFCIFQPEKFSVAIEDAQLYEILTTGECQMNISTFESIISKFDFYLENSLEQKTVQILKGEDHYYVGETIKVEINEIGVPFINYVMPQMENGRVLVPVRAIFEACDAIVDWDEENETVLIQKDNNIIEIPINSYEIKKNGLIFPLDVPAKIINGSTLVPIRAVAELLGARVEWSDSPQLVSIYLE